MALTDWNWTCTDWILVMLILCVTLYLYGISTFGWFSKQNIPHDKPLPFIGNMGAAMCKKQHFPDFLKEMYNKFEPHQYFGIYVFCQPFLILKDLEIIKSVTIKDFEYFTDRRSFFNERLETLWTKGLFTLKGKRWKEMRSTLSAAFTSSKMKTMFLLVTECCQQLVNHLESCLQENSKARCSIQKEDGMLVLELKDLYTRYTNDVIATTAFGIGVNSLEQPTNEFYMMGQAATNFEGARQLKWLGILFFPKLLGLFGITLFPSKVTEFFRSLILKTVSTREKEGILRPDMLQLLMQARRGTLYDEDSSDINKINKISLDDDDMIAQALLFFIAGFDTSSTLLCFASYELAVNSDVQTKLQQEIDRTMDENGGKFTYEAVNNMKYLDMVVSETLRMYPPASLAERLCVKPYTLHADPPLELQPGDSIYIPIVGLHHDPKYYNDPERFDPERFSEDNIHLINPLAYIPFGIGPRNCIGTDVVFVSKNLNHKFDEREHKVEIYLENTKFMQCFLP